MSDVEKEPTEVAKTEPVETPAEAPAAVAEANTAAPAAEPAVSVASDAAQTNQPEEVKVEEVAPAKPAVVETPVTETVEKVVDEFENMTIFGNKSLDELHQIQSKKSHLSAGILFTDPALKM
jgi:muconolactone delta-isomerase